MTAMMVVTATPVAGVMVTMPATAIAANGKGGGSGDCGKGGGDHDGRRTTSRKALRP